MAKNKLKLRDKLALKAMEIIYNKIRHLENYKELSKKAYLMADTMLETREIKK